MQHFENVLMSLHLFKKYFIKFKFIASWFLNQLVHTVNDQKCPTLITELGIWEEHSVQVNLVHETNPTMNQFPTYR